MNKTYLRVFLPTVTLAAIVLTGCGHPRPYYPPPPPPPPPPGAMAVPPLVDVAERNGFRGGVDDGRRDALSGFGYHPKHDRRFHDAPGYDPNLGPRGPYVQYFRGAYLRGYDKGFYQR